MRLCGDGPLQTVPSLVTPSWDKKKYTIKADATGKWKITNSHALPPADPMTQKCSDGEIVTLHNVMIGEVWLCSGQSNMEMPMKGFRDQPVRGSNDAIFNSSNDNIRLYILRAL